MPTSPQFEGQHEAQEECHRGGTYRANCCGGFEEGSGSGLDFEILPRFDVDHAELSESTRDSPSAPGRAEGSGSDPTPCNITEPKPTSEQNGWMARAGDQKWVGKVPKDRTTAPSFAAGGSDDDFRWLADTLVGGIAALAPALAIVPEPRALPRTAGPEASTSTKQVSAVHDIDVKVRSLAGCVTQ